MLLGVILAVVFVGFGVWWAQKKERSRQDAYLAGYVAGKARTEQEMEPPLSREEQLEATEWKILHDKGLMKDSYPEWQRKRRFMKEMMKGEN